MTTQIIRFNSTKKANEWIAKREYADLLEFHFTECGGTQDGYFNTSASIWIVYNTVQPILPQEVSK